MIIIPDQEVEYFNDRIVLIDADCVAYYGAAGCDELPSRSAFRRIDLRMEQIIDDCGTKNNKSFLTGRTNFRDDVATLKRYKEGRYSKDGKRTKEQPMWLQECRQYLIDNWGATVSVYEEADDTISIAAANLKDKYEVYISSLDKDLRINPVLYHNQASGDITESDYLGSIKKVKTKLIGSGGLFFYSQMLMGDSVDSIQGLPKVTQYMKDTYGVPRLGGCGASAAWHVLKDVQTLEEAERRVFRCYASYWDFHTYFDWRSDLIVHKAGRSITIKQFIEQGRLLWMRTKVGEMWIPKYLTEKELNKREI